MGILFQWDLRVCIPVLGKKMVIKYIHNNTGVFPVTRPQAQYTFQKNRMTVTIAVNCPVKHNAPAYPIRVIFPGAALDRIGNEIAYHQLLIVSGEIQVR